MNLLAPLAFVYGHLMDVRNRLYDRGILRSHSLGAETISIGNLTAGGTGKTPLVSLTAEILAENGERVCVIARGYKRQNEKTRVLVSDGESVLVDALQGGDEPVETARRLLGKAVVVADADRVTAAEWAVKKFGITAVVLDDAFQHRRARRDVDIVCIDATNPFGGAVIPAGTARERPNALSRADAVIVTRVDLAGDIEKLNAEVRRYAPRAAIFHSQNKIKRLTPVAAFSVGSFEPGTDVFTLTPDTANKEKQVLAFCGLGNPESFFKLLEREFASNPTLKITLAAVKRFPDHYFYDQSDIDRLVHLAGANIDAMITTAKDAVKLSDLKFEVPCYVAEIEPLIDDEAGFRELIISS